jgi:hypothetical protein
MNDQLVSTLLEFLERVSYATDLAQVNTAAGMCRETLMGLDPAQALTLVSAISGSL